MSEMNSPAFSLPSGFESKLDSVLQQRWSLSLASSREIANAVQRMSDFYVEQPLASTPWAERWCQIAQIAYYRPLNFLRAQRVMREAQRLGFFRGIDEVVDFGAGLGPVQEALLSLEGIPRFSMKIVERSLEAQKISRELGLEFQTQTLPTPTSSQSLLTCSYSLTELENPPAWLFKFDNLILIEPATRQDGRLLLELRKRLIGEGYHMWAPCTHQEGCPLLEKNPHDWCHDRLHFARPDWMLAVEKYLPFENPTLTMSYLVTSRRPRPAANQTIRTVGDLMREKGKARQMICRRNEREFFAWMSRNGEPQEIPRGILCEMPSRHELKSNEIRVQSEVPWQH